MCKRKAFAEPDELREPQMAQTTATELYRTTIEQYVPTETLKTWAVVPFRFLDRFIARQNIACENGSRKKRWVSASELEGVYPFAQHFRAHSPHKEPTVEATLVPDNSHPDDVWGTPPKIPAAKAISTLTCTQDLAVASSPYNFDPDYWNRSPGSTQTQPISLRRSRVSGDDHPRHQKYLDEKYGSKAEDVYNDPCALDLQFEKLRGRRVTTDADDNDQDSVLDNIMTFNEDASLFAELPDIGDPLEDPSHVFERSMLSRELARELMEELPANIDSPSLPSSPQLQPSAIDSPPLVAPLAQDELENLTQIAQLHGSNPAAPLTELPNATLTSHDFGTLLPQMFNGDAKGWLNDNIINEYLEILVNRAQEMQGYVYVRGKGGSPPPVHAFKSQWFTTMKTEAQKAARWARPVHLLGEKLLECNLVLLPICHNSHWRLVAIKPKDRLIEYFDSLHGPGTQFTQLAKQWVQLVLQKHYVEDEWTVSEEQKSEGQVNASDCGIFTLLNALVLLRGEEHHRVQVTNGMDDARLRVAATLLAKVPTTEMDCPAL